MSLKKSLIKNTGFNLAGYFYLLIASFFSISILLQHLGRDVFGIYIFLASFIALSSVFDLGISNAVVRKLSLPQTNREEKVAIWKTSFSIFISIGFLLFATVSALLLFLSKTLQIFSHIDSSTLSWSILLIAIIVFVNFINNHFLTLPQAEQRFDVFNSKTLLVGTSNTLISALIAFNYPNIAAIFAAQLVFHLLTFIYLAHYCYRVFPGPNFNPLYSRDSGRELFSFGIKNFVGTMAGQIESQFSNYVLGAMVSAQSITSFNIPQSIVTKGAGIVSQFAQAFFPLSASLLEKDRIHKLKKLVIGVEALTLLGGIIAVILTFTVGQEFLAWWLKDPIIVQSSFPILKILSFYFLLVSLTPVPTVLIQAINKPQIPSFFALLTVGIEIVMSLVLVPKFHALGVAYAFLISTVISVPLFIGVSWHLFQKEIKKTLSLP